MGTANSGTKIGALAFFKRDAWCLPLGIEVLRSAEVHALDEVVGDGVFVLDLAIKKHGAREVFDDLVDTDLISLASLCLGDLDGLYGRVKLLPLTCPIGAYLVFSGDAAAFAGFGPADGVGHEGEGGVDVAFVKGGVCGGDEGFGVGHGFSILSSDFSCSFSYSA